MATRAALPLIDLIAAASAPLAHELPGRSARRRAQVLPCGVDLERFRPIARGRARGAAWPRRREARCLLFAADPARAEKRYDRAQALAHALGVELLTLGGVEPGEVPLWINAANAVLVPSEREGFGLAVLEALACDVPVLATPVGIHREALADVDGTLCAPFELDRWRAAVEPHLRAGDPRVDGRASAAALLGLRDGRARRRGMARDAGTIWIAWIGCGSNICRHPPNLPVAAPADSPAPAAAVQGAPPGFRTRGRARRRARFLRRARELAYRDLGGLVFNLHRFGQRNDALVTSKLSTLAQIDTELRSLENALHEHRPVTVLREAGISACPRCAAIHSGEDRFCPNCGLPMSRHVDLPIAGASPPTAAGSDGAPHSTSGPGAPPSFTATPQPPPASPAAAPADRAAGAGTQSPVAPAAPAPPAPPPSAGARKTPPAPQAPGKAAGSTAAPSAPPPSTKAPPAPAVPPASTREPGDDEPTKILRPPAGGL